MSIIIKKIEDISTMDSYIRKEIGLYPNKSFATLYKLVREKYSLISDYLLLFHLAGVLHKNGQKLTRPQVINACKNALEYAQISPNERKQWVSTICEKYTP